MVLQKKGRLLFVSVLLLLGTGCQSSSEGKDSIQKSKNSPQSSSSVKEAKSWYRPALDTIWQIQLSGKLNTSYDVKLYDVDLFDTASSTIASLQAEGKKVICYFSAGSYEAWREDSKLFLPEVIGEKMEGWDERWLDIRAKNVWEIMQKRLDLAKTKGCDGVDPDNVNGYEQKSGFDLTAKDQLAFNLFLAKEAHKRGLAIGLKNDIDQSEELVEWFDFMVNEECMRYRECDKVLSFVESKKPVFHLEYDTEFFKDREKLCQESKALGLQTLLMPLDLDDTFRFSCQ